MNAGFVTRDEAIHRVSGTLAFRDLPEWAFIREVGVDWEDVFEAAARDAVQLLPNGWDAPSVSPGLTTEEALKDLVAAVQEAGLAEFSWPASNGVSPNTLTLLAHQVRQANKELCAGTDWSGPLLGLAGRVGIRLGALREGDASGNCSTPPGSVVTTRVDAGWGPVAHEWLHALDGSLASSLLAKEAFLSDLLPQGSSSKMAPEVVAWKKALADLRAPDVSAEVAQELVRQTLEGLMARMGVAASAFAREELTRMGRPDWNRREALKRALPVARQKDDDDELGTLRAELMLTELEMVRSFRQNPPEARSVWVHFAERFRDNLLAHHKTLKSWADYLLDPAEQMAHSFEAGIRGALISDVGRSASGSLRYPLPVEQSLQGQTWTRLFSQLKSWWSEFSGTPQAEAPLPVQLDTSLSERILARRSQQAKTKAAAPSPPVPLAARPRMGA